MTFHLFDDLYLYNGWANRKLFQLCSGLTDEQLDQTREMGLGSLRNTLFHVILVEELWLERWLGKPWRALGTEAKGATLDFLQTKFEQVESDRQELINSRRPNRWQTKCEYRDSKGNSHHNRLDEMLLHVVNHGIHHRAQALNFLKHFGRGIKGGLDYLFYKLARPSQPQEAEAMETLRQWGLETNTGSSESLQWDFGLVKDWFAYSDWANQKLAPLLVQLDNNQLDADQKMGLGTIRKTALHMLDAERWWLGNWTVGPTEWQTHPETTSIRQLEEEWGSVQTARNKYLSELDESSANQRITVSVPGGPKLSFAAGESAIQLCGHGTHHRAQLLNMIRRTGLSLPQLDYIVWRREVNAQKV